MRNQELSDNLYKNALVIAWPAIIESFFMSFTGLVDSLMVSKLGAYAVAAVGLTTQPKFLALSLFIATTIALSALVARRRGEQKKEDANAILLSGLIFIIGASIVISVVTFSLANPIIALCGSTEDTHEAAVIYFRIIMAGLIFNCISMGINSAQRGAGNTKITMRTNMTSNIINIIFNWLLITGNLGFPAWGIYGAAFATVLGSAVACVMSIVSIFDKDCFISIPYIIQNKIMPTLAAFRNIVKVGYSVFFEQILMRVGFMATAIMAAHQGTNAMAAHQVCMNLMGLTFSFGDGLQSAAVALIGRSLGAGDKDMAKKYGKICMIYGICIAALLSVVYYAGAEALMSLFFVEPEIIAIGVSIVRVIIFVVVFQIIQVVYMGCLRGAGDTLYTAIASTLSVTVFRTAGSYICGILLGWGIIGIWIGVLVDQTSRFIFAVTRYTRGKWTEIKI
ncbi:MAG: MATE family efflux transporter [Treponemataceae bacterium]|nr:MATE family efflux transporter [Treponemataceae bacterium]